MIGEPKWPLQAQPQSQTEGQDCDRVHLYPFASYTEMDISLAMQKPLIPVKFLGDSKRVMRDWPDSVKRLAGYEIMRLQVGDEPLNWKPLKDFPAGTREIRLKTSASAYRVIYAIKAKDAIYIVHAYQKKSQKISKANAVVIRDRMKLI